MIVPIYIKVYGKEVQIGSCKIRFCGTEKIGSLEFVKANILMKKGDTIHNHSLDLEKK